MTTTSRIDDETVMMLCAHSQHMTTMRGYADQRARHNRMLDSERRARQRRNADDADDERDLERQQAQEAKRETEALLSEHRAWNGLRGASQGGWKHFG